jgi:2-methylcitrate dehydratase PrpD
MDAIYRFSKNFVQTNYEDLPQEIVEVTKKSILDLLGVAVAGFTSPGVRGLLDIAIEWGGKEESSVICSKQKVPAPMAAQVNSTMGHALDYDDVHDRAVMHPGVVVIPTCMAVAERKGSVDGKEFISAVVLGVDMMCRLGLATRPGYSPSSGEIKEGAFQSERVKQGWHLTSLMGYLGAAGVAGKLMGLNEEKLLNAFGIAYHQCSGNLQCRIEGAQTKRLGPGFASRAGIAAALMAERGITGAQNCLEGEQGLYKMYYQGGYDLKTLIEDLGRHFEGLNVSIKPYPCCRGVHTYIDAALALINTKSIKAEDVREIKIFSDDGGYHALCMPLEARTRPRNQVDSQFSIPWGVATALAKKRVGMEHFTQAAIKDQGILGVASKIKVELDPSLGRPDKIPPGKLDVAMKNGEVYSKQVNDPLGSPERPMSFDDCARKFRDCLSHSPNDFSNQKIENVIEFIRYLETARNIEEITKLLAAK